VVEPGETFDSPEEINGAGFELVKESAKVAVTADKPAASKEG
jgi:hypothetical protein